MIVYGILFGGMHPAQEWIVFSFQYFKCIFLKIRPLFIV